LPWAPQGSYVRPEPGTWAPPGGWLLLVSAPHERAVELNALLTRADLTPAEVRHFEVSLEQYFLTLTGAFGAAGYAGAPAYQIESVESAPAAQGDQS